MVLAIIGFILVLVGGLGAVASIPPRRGGLTAREQFRQPAAKRGLLLAGIGVLGAILVVVGR